MQQADKQDVPDCTRRLDSISTPLFINRRESPDQGSPYFKDAHSIRTCHCWSYNLTIWIQRLAVTACVFQTSFVLQGPPSRPPYPIKICVLLSKGWMDIGHTFSECSYVVIFQSLCHQVHSFVSKENNHKYQIYYCLSSEYWVISRGSCSFQRQPNSLICARPGLVTPSMWSRVNGLVTEQCRLLIRQLQAEADLKVANIVFLLFLHIQFLLRKIYRKLQEVLFKQVTPSSVHNSHCHTQGILGKDIEFLSFYSLLFPGLMLQNATNIHISAIKSIQSILVVTLFKSEVVDSKQSNQICRGGQLQQ